MKFLEFGFWDLGFGTYTSLSQPCSVGTMRVSFVVLRGSRSPRSPRRRGAQTSSTSPDTKGPDSSLIRLDIHPTADGHPVQDLAAADLDLIEDGTPQKIDTLTHATDPARSFVVFLDTPHMRFEGARDVRVALVRFLDRLLDDDDVVGVMTPDITPADIRFGPKASVIAGIMQDETLWERARVGSRDPKEDRYAQCFPANQYRDVASEMQERHREQATLDSLSRLIDSWRPPAKHGLRLSR